MAMTHDIVNRIGKTPEERPTKDGLELAIKHLAAEPSAMADMIERTRSTDEELKRIVTESYWHCNGFARIVLLASKSCTLRLHIWPRGAGVPMAVNPHGHRWEFASWVATGPGIRESYFSRTENAEALAYDLYDYDGKGILRPRNEQVRLREHPLDEYKSGTIYSCASEVVHAVEPIGDELVATIVLQGPSIARPAPVYVRPGNSPNGAERSMCADELLPLLIKTEAGIRRQA